jgi:hypothetical protein
MCNYDVSVERIVLDKILESGEDLGLAHNQKRAKIVIG